MVDRGTFGKTSVILNQIRPNPAGHECIILFEKLFAEISSSGF